MWHSLPPATADCGVGGTFKGKARLFPRSASTRLCSPIMALKQLPDPILLCIVFESGIATLKHLRLVCHNFNALIQAYGKSIRAKDLDRQYTQEVVDCFDVLWREKNHLTALFVTDGRIQEARWMAAVRLRTVGNILRHRAWIHDLYPTYDIMSMWEYVVMGLGIMWRLHDYATQEICLDFGYDARHAEGYMSDITIDYPQLEKLEKRILRKQIIFVENLTMGHRKSLYHALGFCVRVLYPTRNTLAPKSDPDPKPGVIDNWKLLWVKWLVLREGPAFIATTWRSEAAQEMHSELIGRAFTNRNRTQMDTEMAGVTPLYEAVVQGILGTDEYTGPDASPYLIASEGEIAELEHWSAEQGLAHDNQHLELGRPREADIKAAPAEYFANMAAKRMAAKRDHS